MNACAVIVAAGTGRRMGNELGDKLWIKVAGEPVLAHTWRRLEDCPDVRELRIVINPRLAGKIKDLATRHGFRKPYELVAGGAERQDSVWNGLQALPAQADLVAVQDGARPCTAPELISQCLLAASRSGAAVAAAPVTDTIKESSDGEIIARHLDRRKLWAVSTPQAFHTSILRHALEEARLQGRQYTDDSAACEGIGQSVQLVPVQEPNPKLTVPADLAYVELLLRDRFGIKFPEL